MSAKGLPAWSSPHITVEHIMPQTLSPEWEDYLGDDAELHADFLNKLGNLALTSNNPEMSNKPFSAKGNDTSNVSDRATDKRSWYAESSFHYTRDIARLGDWSVERIRERGEQLADRCLETWTLPAAYQPEAETTSKGRRRPPFRFSMVGLGKGDEVVFARDSSKTATVVDDWHVSFEGKTYSLSGLAMRILNKRSIAGPWHFTYNGTLLGELRDKAEASACQDRLGDAGE